MFTRFLIFFIVLVISSCEGGVVEPPAELAKLSVVDSRVFEKDGNSNMIFEVQASKAVETTVDITYTLAGKSAKPGVDFNDMGGTVSIDAGASKTTISVEILDDLVKEVDEKFELILSSATNATISDGKGIGLIQDNEVADNFVSDGYITDEEHYGYQLSWADEFTGTSLDTDVYNYELENGCPNLCGWGNMELQWYTDLPQNIYVDNSHLVITATKQGAASFNSARIQTKGKKEFQFGRIDIRARMPKGQGIWPAIWMLGSNIDDVGWPACGEIDITEVVGHKPRASHGTAHWGAQGDLNSTSSSAVYSLSEDFQEKFHVFSIVWEQGEITWYIDETRFHRITTNDMKGKPYPFNQSMFFIFNVAVGGQWPGSPDETTEFPQSLEIDYIRVFQ